MSLPCARVSSCVNASNFSGLIYCLFNSCNNSDFEFDFCLLHTKEYYGL